ncbi:MAG TPA: SRPBCC domain-containing protein [Anaerolineae bacterium]|nr:SRPBCC domain-containing protein [Anaerolineae bacterium]
MNNKPHQTPIAGTLRVPLPPEELWPALINPDYWENSLPGCLYCQRFNDNQFQGRVILPHGPGEGVYQGVITLSQINPSHSYRLSLQSGGGGSTIRGNGRVDLIATTDGTEIRYDGNIVVDGTLNDYPQRLHQTWLRSLIRQGVEGVVAQARGQKPAHTGLTATHTHHHPWRRWALVGGAFAFAYRWWTRRN